MSMLNTFTYVGLGLVGAGVAAKMLKPEKPTADEAKLYDMGSTALIGGGLATAFYGAFMKDQTRLQLGPASSR